LLSGLGRHGTARLPAPPLPPRPLHLILPHPRPPPPTLFPYTTLFRSALLVDRSGTVLIEAENGYMPFRDATAHAERLLATQACTDRKSTRLNSSHEWISYAVFCLKKKVPEQSQPQQLVRVTLSANHDI